MCQVFVAIRSRFPARRVGEDAFVPKHRAKAKPVAVHGPLACAAEGACDWMWGEVSTLKACLTTMEWHNRWGWPRSGWPWSEWQLMWLAVGTWTEAQRLLTDDIR